MKRSLKIATAAATVALPIIFLGIMALNFFSNDPKWGLFLKTMKEASDLFRVDITPASWAFSIWSVIYIWQGAFIVYLIVCLFRKTPRRVEHKACGCEVATRFYEDPGSFPLSSLLFYTASYVLTTAWLFLFDRATASRPLLVWASVVLWLTVAVLGLSLFFSYRHLGGLESELISSYRARADVWAIRILAHNGISVYATWCAVAAPLNLAITLAHFTGVRVDLAGSVALGVAGLEMLVYAVVDLAVLDRWTRYVLTPHCTFVWAFGASLVKNYHWGHRNTTMTIVLLALAVAAVVAKVVATAVRHVRRAKTDRVNMSGHQCPDAASITTSSTVDPKKPIV